MSETMNKKMEKKADILQEFYFAGAQLIREELTLTYLDGLTPPLKEITTDAALAQWTVELWQFTHEQLCGYKVSLKQIVHKI